MTKTGKRLNSIHWFLHLKINYKWNNFYLKFHHWVMWLKILVQPWITNFLCKHQHHQWSSSRKYFIVNTLCEHFKCGLGCFTNYFSMKKYLVFVSLIHQRKGFFFWRKFWWSLWLSIQQKFFRFVSVTFFSTEIVKEILWWNFSRWCFSFAKKHFLNELDQFSRHYFQKSDSFHVSLCSNSTEHFSLRWLSLNEVNVFYVSLFSSSWRWFS